MAQCGQTLLQSAYDSYCGEITPLADEDIQALATRGSSEIMNHYIGHVDPAQAYEPGVPPYTAMMARKILMTESTRTKSREKFVILAQKNTVLQSSFEQLLSAYGNVSLEGLLNPGGVDSYPGRVSVMQDRYLDAVARAQALLDLAERWEKGLTTDGNKQDLRVVLDGMLEDLENQFAFLKGKPDQEGDKGLLGLIERVVQNIAALAEANSNDNKAVTNSMCALYFCDLRGRDAEGLGNTCRIDSDPDMNKTKFVYEENPLCDQNAKPATADLRKLCARAGFPETLTNLDSLPKAQRQTQANTCMKAHFNKKLLASARKGSAT
ncbi:MAG: hypothetical protein M3Q07_24235, partial [Pseudobdellovibrionaceae bacterium]|nr:hypothetical protein [Pseudobdellovibrionaceae bacterium]